MAKVRLSGRFPKGTRVTLYEVKDESVLRPEGSKEVDSKRVKDDGTVTFTGVEEGKRYMAQGNVAGSPVTVRLTGRQDDAEATFQAPVQNERVRLADGSWLDEEPEQHQKLPSNQLEAAPHLNQVNVPKGVKQRSDTPRGSAHPVDPDETPPYGRQEDVKKGVQQRSDTATGRATPIDVSYQRQEDVPNGVWQRSATPLGVATPIPGGGPVEAQRMKESVEAKEKRGEPVRAAAEPLTGVEKVHSDPKSTDLATGPKTGGKEVSNEPAGVSQPTAGERDDKFVGRDAEGQPVGEDVAAASGEEPADSPAEPTRRTKKK